MSQNSAKQTVNQVQSWLDTVIKKPKTPKKESRMNHMKSKGF